MTAVTPAEGRQEKSFGGDFKVADDIPPLVAPGRYRVMLDDYRTAQMFNKAHKLILDFSIVSFGEYFGVRLPRYYCPELTDPSNEIRRSEPDNSVTKMSPLGKKSMLQGKSKSAAIVSS